MIDLLTHPLVDTLGQVLLHFVWQGALVAAALALALRLMRRRPAEERYAAALAALVLMVALPPATWWALPAATAPEATPVRAAAPSTLPASPAASLPSLLRFNRFHAAAPSDETVSEKAVSEETVSEKAAAGWTEAAAMRARRWSGAAAATAPWMALGWLLGVAALALRMAGGWWHTCRLQREAVAVEDAQWQRRFTTLVRQMGLRRLPALLRSTRLDSPATVGWWRPVVLVPAGFLTGMPPEQVEAILRHELAHIRRYDYLAALAQAVAETLLFYHPAVWWVSGRVRTLREHCCDERAARCAESRLAYARALTELEGARTAGFALSAAEGDLFERVCRVLQEPGASRSSRLAPALAALLLAATVALAACAPRAVGAETEASAARPEAPRAPEAAAAPQGPPPAPAPPDTTTSAVRIFASARSDTTRAPRVIRITGDTLHLDSLSAFQAGFDDEAWQRWGEQMEDWGERFRQQWAADSSQWKAWAKRMGDWGDSLSVAFSSDSSVVLRSLPSFPDSFDVRVPDLPVLDSLTMKVLSVDSVLASAPAFRLDTLPHVSSVSVVAPHVQVFDVLSDSIPRAASLRERQALRRAARHLEERAVVLEEQGQEEAAEALRKEAERLHEDAAQAGEALRRRQGAYRERLRQHREQMEHYRKRMESRQERRIRREARRQQRQALRQQAQVLRQQAEELSTQAEQQQKEAEALQDQLAKLRAEEASEERIEALQARIQALQAQIQAIPKQVLTLRNESRELRRRADRMERKQGNQAGSDGDEMQDID